MSLQQAVGTKGKTSNLAYPSEATHKKILQGTSFTIPESQTLTSPSTGNVAHQPSFGAILFAISSNDPSTNEMANYQPKQFDPGQTISVTVAANVLNVLVDGVPVFTITGTALTEASAQIFHM